MKKKIVFLIIIVVVVIIGMIIFKKTELISDEEKVTDIFIVYNNYEDIDKSISYELCKESCSADIQTDNVDLSERFEDVIAVLSDHYYANTPFTLAYNNDFLNYFLGLSLPYSGESLLVIVSYEDDHDPISFMIYKDLDQLFVNDAVYHLRGNNDIYQELSVILGNLE